MESIDWLLLNSYSMEACTWEYITWSDAFNYDNNKWVTCVHNGYLYVRRLY